VATLAIPAPRPRIKARRMRMGADKGRLLEAARISGLPPRAGQGWSGKWAVACR
jgi:hypothetical protein